MSLRSPLAVLNELSVPGPTDQWTDDSLQVSLTGFVAVLHSARDIRPDLSLWTSIPLAGTPIAADGRTLGRWASGRGGPARDQLQYLQLLRSRAPVGVAPGLRLLQADEEYRVLGRVAEGLGLAVANSQLSVSFDSTAWPSASVELTHLQLNAASVLTESTVIVAHASTVEHVHEHIELLRRLALPHPFNGTDIWSDRTKLYPSLQFLSGVEAQLGALAAGSAHIQQVARRLGELQATASAWRPATEPEPQWLCNVRPEAQSRKRLCWFIDTDGIQRCFDLHVEFTPGPGRIHLRLHGATGTFVIAHIGRKLGS